MKRLHLKCENYWLITKNDNDNSYWSGAWYFKLESAKSLIGGHIYFHNRKSEPSYFGGQVMNARQILYEGKNRVEFKFKKLESCKGVAWEGDNTQRTWHSGFLT